MQLKDSFPFFSTVSKTTLTTTVTSHEHTNISITNLHSSQQVTTSSEQTEHLHDSKVSRLTQKRPTEVTTASITDIPSSNFLELPTEKLSLTNKSLPSRLFSDALTDSSTNLTRNGTAVAAADSLVSNSSNVHYGKSSKQRGASNSLGKPSSGSGGIRISGQKIEMPQLNNFFDHSAYLKKHEHGFR